MNEDLVTTADRPRQVSEPVWESFIADRAAALAAATGGDPAEIARNGVAPPRPDEALVLVAKSRMRAAQSSGQANPYNPTLRRATT